uniref:Uncharacterized protein n=2 Tax=Rhizophagus irregularis TaxID=588596 RepID=U9UY18_RHIID
MNYNIIQLKKFKQYEISNQFFTRIWNAISNMTKFTKIIYQENIDLLFAISSVVIKSDALKFCEENTFIHIWARLLYLLYFLMNNQIINFSNTTDLQKNCAKRTKSIQKNQGMFDIVQHKNIGLELEIAKYKRLTEDLNKKFNEVNNNYQKNINGWKELYYYQVGVSEELKEKYYKKIGDAEEWKKKYYEEFIKKHVTKFNKFTMTINYYLKIASAAKNKKNIKTGIINIFAVLALRNECYLSQKYIINDFTIFFNDNYCFTLSRMPTTETTRFEELVNNY